MMVARWSIDPKFGYKQNVIDLMRGLHYASRSFHTPGGTASDGRAGARAGNFARYCSPDIIMQIHVSRSRKT